MASQIAGAGHCVRVIPANVVAGGEAEFFRMHAETHTPAVRRQPGFISKLVMQSDDDPTCTLTLLTWETPEQAVAWVRQPEHDEIGQGMRHLRPPTPAEVLRGAPRGGYHVVEAVYGA